MEYWIKTGCKRCTGICLDFNQDNFHLYRFNRSENIAKKF